jgi:hypothetical protein
MEAYKTRKDNRRAAEALDLAERKLALWRQGVLLAVTVLFSLATLYCALRGYHWEMATFTGGPGTASTLALGVEALRGRR